MLPRLLHGRICLAAAGCCIATASASAQMNAFSSNETVSLGLQLVDSSQRSTFVNGFGHQSVQRGIDTDLGPNAFGTGRIRAIWNDTPQATDNLLTITFYSSNGEDMFPSGRTVPGGGVGVFWQWQIGTTNLLSLLPTLTTSIESASYTLITPISTPSFPLNMGSTWTGQVPSTLQNTVGNGISAVQISIYHKPVVPAPGALALAGAAGLAAARRRRR